MKTIFTSLMILILNVCGTAQNSEIGIGLGLTNYWGDLNVVDNLENLKNGRPAIRIHARYLASERINHKVGLVFGKLFGSDENAQDELRASRNLNFYSPLVELSYALELNLLPYRSLSNKLHVAPYLSAGLGMFHFNPKTNYNGEEVVLQPLGTEGQGVPGNKRNKYKRLQLSVPVGAGIKVNLGNGFALEGSFIFSYTFTDYIDDVSSNYPNYNLVLQHNGELAAFLSDRRDEFFGLPEGSFANENRVRGGADANDYYFTTMISISYILNKNIFSLGSGTKCPSQY